MKLSAFPVFLLISVSGGPEDGAGEILDRLDSAITMTNTQPPATEEATSSMFYISAGHLDATIEEDDDEDELVSEGEITEEMLADDNTLVGQVIPDEAPVTHDMDDMVKELNALDEPSTESDAVSTGAGTSEEDVESSTTTEEPLTEETTTEQPTEESTPLQHPETVMLEDEQAKKLLSDTDMATALMGVGIAGFMAHVAF